MFLTQKKEFKKVFTPGYTGHVPQKKKLFGVTTGNANQILITKNGQKTFETGGSRHPGACSNIGQRNKSAGANLRVNQLKYGNWSKNAVNWISGPNHEIRYQHVPGYTGHVPGIKSENLYAKSYARTTATANSNKRFNPNYGKVTNKNRFLTNHDKEFSPNNFRRYLDTPQLLKKKDYQDYATSLNHEKYNQKNKILTTSDVKTMNTICSNTGTNFFSPSNARTRRSVVEKQSHDFDMRTTTIKPKLLESKVLNQQNFFNMSDGFKQIFANDRKDEDLVIPITGYKGHKRGDKSQNFFGRSFRDCAIQSRKLERSLKSPVR